MSPTPTRRALLRTGGTAALLAVGGCLLDNQETAVGHLYAENTSGSERRLALWVARRTDGTPEPEISARYRVPDATALEFEGVLDPAETYEVRASLTDASSADAVRATIDPCPEGQDEGGERVVSVRTRPDGLGVIPFGCQESYTQRDLEYVPADEHRTGSLTDAPTTDATPGSDSATAAGSTPDD